MLYCFIMNEGVYMLILSSLIILLIVVFIIGFSHYQVIRSYSIFHLGTFISAIAIILYNMVTFANYKFGNGLFGRVGYFIVNTLHISLSQIVVAYNIGTFLIMIACILFLIIYEKRLRIYHLFMILLSIFYVIANHPRSRYMIWNYGMLHDITNTLSKLATVNTIILLLILSLPISKLIIDLTKTKIYLKRTNISYTILYVFALEVITATVLLTNSYSNFYPCTIDVNLLPLRPNEWNSILFSIHSQNVGIIISVIVILLISATIFTINPLLASRRRRNSINMSGDISSEENLKTIFHSYKNAFFAVERFASIVESGVDKSNTTAVSALQSIKEISSQSYGKLSLMLDNVIQTLNFNHKKEDFELDLLLDELLLQFESIDGITFIKNLPDDAIYINANREDIGDAITNIINNSIEAVENRPEPIVKVDLFTEGNNAVINVFDNGYGIAPHNLRHVFKPLYSSKYKDTNLGIGLSSALKTIESNGGTITPKSKLEKYTIFQITLPLAKLI